MKLIRLIFFCFTVLATSMVSAQDASNSEFDAKEAEWGKMKQGKRGVDSEAKQKFPFLSKEGIIIDPKIISKNEGWDNDSLFKDEATCNFQANEDEDNKITVEITFKPNSPRCNLYWNDLSDNTHGLYFVQELYDNNNHREKKYNNVYLAMFRYNDLYYKLIRIQPERQYKLKFKYILNPSNNSWYLDEIYFDNGKVSPIDPKEEEGGPPYINKNGKFSKRDFDHWEDFEEKSLVFSFDELTAGLELKNRGDSKPIHISNFSISNSIKSEQSSNEESSNEDEFWGEEQITRDDETNNVEKFALVIGCGNYKTTDSRTFDKILGGAHRDAEGMKDKLEKWRYKVSYINPDTEDSESSKDDEKDKFITKRQLDDEKASLIREINKAKNNKSNKIKTMVYFAGHGYSDTITGYQYMALSDDKIENNTLKMINQDYFKDIYELSDEFVLFVDACRSISDNFLPKQRGETKVVARGEIPVSNNNNSNKNSFIIMTALKGKGTEDIGSKTNYFLEKLKENDKQKSLIDLYQIMLKFDKRISFFKYPRTNYTNFDEDQLLNRDEDAVHFYFHKFTPND